MGERISPVRFWFEIVSRDTGPLGSVSREGTRSRGFL
jgi:hypothetical protein